MFKPVPKKLMKDLYAELHKKVENAEVTDEVTLIEDISGIDADKYFEAMHITNNTLEGRPDHGQIFNF